MNEIIDLDEVKTLAEVLKDAGFEVEILENGILII